MKKKHFFIVFVLFTMLSFGFSSCGGEEVEVVNDYPELRQFLEEPTSCASEGTEGGGVSTKGDDLVVATCECGELQPSVGPVWHWRKNNCYPLPGGKDFFK